MSLDRRQLLRYTGAACLLFAAPGLARAAGSLQVHEVRDLAAAPLFAPGDVLLVDTAVTQFSGAGVYLYPAWGKPRPYQVRAAGTLLEFRNPASGLLLWTQSAQLHSLFAGLVLDPSSLARHAYPVLRVPALPA